MGRAKSKDLKALKTRAVTFAEEALHRAQSQITETQSDGDTHTHRSVVSVDMSALYCDPEFVRLVGVTYPSEGGRAGIPSSASLSRARSIIQNFLLNPYDTRFTETQTNGVFEFDPNGQDLTPAINNTTVVRVCPSSQPHDTPHYIHTLAHTAYKLMYTSLVKAGVVGCTLKAVTSTLHMCFRRNRKGTDQSYGLRWTVCDAGSVTETIETDPNSAHALEFISTHMEIPVNHKSGMRGGEAKSETRKRQHAHITHGDGDDELPLSPLSSRSPKHSSSESGCGGDVWENNTDDDIMNDSAATLSSASANIDTFASHSIKDGDATSSNNAPIGQFVLPTRTPRQQLRGPENAPSPKTRKLRHVLLNSPSKGGGAHDSVPVASPPMKSSAHARRIATSEEREPTVATVESVDTEDDAQSDTATAPKGQTVLDEDARDHPNADAVIPLYFVMFISSYRRLQAGGDSTVLD